MNSQLQGKQEGNHKQLVGFNSFCKIESDGVVMTG